MFPRFKRGDWVGCDGEEPLVVPEEFLVGESESYREFAKMYPRMVLTNYANSLLNLLTGRTKRNRTNKACYVKD